MKKTLLILSVIVFISLASCDDFNPYASFSPPSWIIGTWGDGGLGYVSYTFSADNILSTSTSITVDFKQAYTEAEIDEEKTDTLYEVTITYAGTINIYRFEKKTDTTLDYSITTIGITVGPVELIRN